VPNLPTALLDRFAAGELIAAIAQDAVSKEVLMMAWMSEESLSLTLKTKQATYWSRSRNSLWVKGESSGHFQEADIETNQVILETVAMKRDDLAPEILSKFPCNVLQVIDRLWRT
jgi:phosphoribosyl-AMP cyclohydrolase